MYQIHAAFPVPVIFLILQFFLFTSPSKQYEVSGFLVDQDQLPIAGLAVMLFDENDEQLASDQSDSLGRFTLVYQAEPTSADPQSVTDMPAEFQLGASYPNPFNPRTTVPVYSPENARIRITVHNILGQLVLRSQAEIQPGSNEIQINLGDRLSQGQYILRVQGDGFSLSQSMTFISAGIGGGSPEILVRPGGRPAASISSHMHLLDEEIYYRIVVEESDRYEGGEISVTPFENLDIGSFALAYKEENTVDWPIDTGTEIVEVTNPATGRVWMDRNLGAVRAATSSTDQQAYGDLYQRGRAADGHQLRNSSTTSTLSNSAQPGHDLFILNPDDPWDWCNTKTDSLWQGINGTNNPCPTGYRIPTEAEWSAERQSWSSNDAAGAFASPLKLPLAGYRSNINGSLRTLGGSGNYWSDAVEVIHARQFNFNNSNATVIGYYRALGFSVRCIRDD